MPKQLVRKRRRATKPPRKGRTQRATSEFKYEVVLNWSEEDHSFVAVVPELSGCAADGSTYQEALANVELVIREWIDTAKELGRSIPVPRGRLRIA